MYDGEYSFKPRENVIKYAMGPDDRRGPPMEEPETNGWGKSADDDDWRGVPGLQ